MPGLTGTDALPSIPKHVRAAVFERDGFACVRCGSTDRLGLDHIIPRNAGGTDELENLRVFCLSCNAAKGNRTDERYSRPITPEGVAAMKESVSAARRELDAANREYLDSIRDAVAAGYTYADIARELGVSRQAVRQLLTR